MLSLPELKLWSSESCWYGEKQSFRLTKLGNIWTESNLHIISLNTFKMETRFQMVNPCTCPLNQQAQGYRRSRTGRVPILESSCLYKVTEIRAIIWTGWELRPCNQSSALFLLCLSLMFTENLHLQDLAGALGHWEWTLLGTLDKNPQKRKTLW